MEAGVVGVREGDGAGRASVTASELSAGRRGGAGRHKEEVESWGSEWQLWRLFLTVGPASAAAPAASLLLRPLNKH